MIKEREGKWIDLERSNKEIAVISWDDSSKVDKNVYPTSSKIKKNWDALAREVVRLFFYYSITNFYLLYCFSLIN